MDIKVTMKDGTVHDFKHEGRAGGSYTKSVDYEPGFVIVKDEWSRTKAFPSEDVAMVETDPHVRGW